MSSIIVTLENNQNNASNHLLMPNVLFWGFFFCWKMNCVVWWTHCCPDCNAEWSVIGTARVLNQLHGGQWRNSSRRIRENNAVKTFETGFALKSVFCCHGSMDLTSVGVRVLHDFLRCETVICMNFLLHELPKPKLIQNVI